MQAYHCNRCKKAIKDPYRDGHVSVCALDTSLGRVDLCAICSPAFLRYLKKYAKIKEKDGQRR